MINFLKNLMFKKQNSSETNKSTSDDEAQISSDAMSRADKIVSDIEDRIYDEAFSLVRKEGRKIVEVSDVDAVAKEILRPNKRLSVGDILNKLEEAEDDANLAFLNAEVRRLNDENDRLQKAYDSTKDTLLHIRRVSELLHSVIADFAERASAHDASKLESPEKELFDEFTPLLNSTTYGSTEYENCLSRLKVALDHHYEKNSHHPEHHPDGIYGMNLFDLLEMLVDWKAATERHADGDMEKSLDINVGRFHISHELYHILKNTIDYMSKKKEWNKNSASEEDSRRSAREERLRQLGFEEPTDEQRKANLALNVALLEWPKE